MPRLSDQELAELLEAATSSGRGDYPGSGDVGKAKQALAAQAPALAQEVLDRRRVGAELEAARPKAIRSAKIEGYALSLHADKHHEPTCKFCIEFWDEIMEQGRAALAPAPGPAGERI